MNFYNVLNLAITNTNENQAATRTSKPPNARTHTWEGKNDSSMAVPCPHSSMSILITNLNFITTAPNNTECVHKYLREKNDLSIIVRVLTASEHPNHESTFHYNSYKQPQDTRTHTWENNKMIQAWQSMSSQQPNQNSTLRSNSCEQWGAPSACISQNASAEDGSRRVRMRNFHLRSSFNVKLTDHQSVIATTAAVHRGDCRDCRKDWQSAQRDEDDEDDELLS